MIYLCNGSPKERTRHEIPTNATVDVLILLLNYNKSISACPKVSTWRLQWAPLQYDVLARPFSFVLSPSLFLSLTSSSGSGSNAPLSSSFPSRDLGARFSVS